MSGAPRAAEDIVVFITRHDGRCAECNDEFFKGHFIRVENGRTLCLDCADLGRLEYLPRGDTAITRRASKYSPLRAVVVQWSRTRQRYERQGILAAPKAIERAEMESLADADLRARQRERAAVRRDAEDQVYVAQVAAAIRALFPGCPADEVEAIAAWTTRKHSGRVGRSAAAKELESDALKLAVVAHIRHEHTAYDELLGRGQSREFARMEVGSAIDRVLQKWSAAAEPRNQ
ncbi:MAG: DUF2293 domain-containing protein [Opitutaceae bacterium]|nr:DUF2293 domain-containing protein [Opitutaceae bacterium]